MIVAIFSDIHGNLPALETFIEKTKNIVDSYLCLGDVVDYGPWNDECLEQIYQLPKIILLEGNHERLFLGSDPIADEIPLVQELYAHSIRSFSKPKLIQNLPVSCELGHFMCTHTLQNKRIYPDTEIEIDRNYIIGHSHYQYQIIRSKDKWIVNPGSIGQNRKYIDLIQYFLYDTTSGKFTACQYPYPFDQFRKELKVRGYSKPCLDYYLKKQKFG